MNSISPPADQRRPKAQRYTERFLLYDVECPYGIPLRVSGAEPSYQVSNSGASSLHDLELYKPKPDGWHTARLAELKAKGAEVLGPVSDQGWGLITSLRLPGGAELGIYQPRHPTAHG